jgi:hypothetical protein
MDFSIHWGGGGGVKEKTRENITFSAFMKGPIHLALLLTSAAPILITQCEKFN